LKLRLFAALVGALITHTFITITIIRLGSQRRLFADAAD
jgi:hypothetical protein